MSDQFAKDCLKAHNEYRRKHGAQPLTLDATVFSISFTQINVHFIFN